MYRCTNLIISICVGEDVYDVGVVEGVDINLEYNGKLELYYGDEAPKHCVGGKIASFSLSRWFYADEGQEDLLLDLFNNKTVFNLRGNINDDKSDVPPHHTSIMITECRLYKYKPRMGKADDIIGEEASGSALGWLTDVKGTGGSVSFFEDWGYPEPPLFAHIYTENWTYGPPSFVTPLFVEPWTYLSPPTMSLKFSEPWSS